MMIGLVQPGTSRGTFLQMIGSRKITPPRMLRMVPFGDFHISFRPNSLTRASSGVMVAHVTPTPTFLMAFAASIVTWSLVLSRYSIPRSKYIRLMSRNGWISLSLMYCQMIRVISSPSSSTTGLVTLMFAMEIRALLESCGWICSRAIAPRNAARKPSGHAVQPIFLAALHVPHAARHGVLRRRCGTHGMAGSRFSTAALHAAVRPGHAHTGRSDSLQHERYLLKTPPVSPYR